MLTAAFADRSHQPHSRSCEQHQKKTSDLEVQHNSHRMPLRNGDLQHDRLTLRTGPPSGCNTCKCHRVLNPHLGIPILQNSREHKLKHLFSSRLFHCLSGLPSFQSPILRINDTSSRRLTGRVRTGTSSRLGVARIRCDSRLDTGVSEYSGPKRHPHRRCARDSCVQCS